MKFKPGDLPLTVVMITLNEGHNLTECINQLNGWASEVCILDSYSNDNTEKIAKEFGVRLIKRKFTYFGDQWNYALKVFKIKNKFTMKIDPDERLTQELKYNIEKVITVNSEAKGFILTRVLSFLGRKLPIRQDILRIWKTGEVKFSNVLVNEHPIINGVTKYISGELLHIDSPNLEHWYDKQNKYTSSEAKSKFLNNNLSFNPRLFGNSNERRMWLKKNFSHIPFRFLLLFYYYYFFKGLFKSGKEGYIWVQLRIQVMRMREFKYYEITKNKNTQKVDL